MESGGFSLVSAHLKTKLSWMDDRLYRALSYAAILTYIGVLVITIVSPAAIVSTVSLLGADDIEIQALAVTGVGKNKLFITGQFALEGVLPCTMKSPRTGVPHPRPRRPFRGVSPRAPGTRRSRSSSSTSCRTRTISSSSGISRSRS